MKDNKIYRIGTDEPKNLKSAIIKAIKWKIRTFVHLHFLLILIWYYWCIYNIKMVNQALVILAVISSILGLVGTFIIVDNLTGNVVVTINPIDNGEIARVDVELIVNGINNSLASFTSGPYQFTFDTLAIEYDTYTIVISVFDKSDNSISVNYAITILNDKPTVSSETSTSTATSTTTTTTTSENQSTQTTSSSSNSVDGANLPLPFDIISSVIGLISLVSLIFVRRKFR